MTLIVKSLLGIVTLCAIGGSTNGSPVMETNSTNDKDMYVINALVYQVGIITNKTSDNQTTGNQEAITFYHTNGSKLDFSHIPTPLITNVTAQRIMEVAPLLELPGNQNATSSEFSQGGKRYAMWSPENSSHVIKGTSEHRRVERRNIFQGWLTHQEEKKDILKEPKIEVPKLFVKRDTLDNKKNAINVVKGLSTLPPGSGLQSIALPPLLMLNNVSSIPVPIPNTSLIQYAKVNAVVRKPY